MFNSLTLSVRVGSGPIEEERTVACGLCRFSKLGKIYNHAEDMILSWQCNKSKHFRGWTSGRELSSSSSGHSAQGRLISDHPRFSKVTRERLASSGRSGCREDWVNSAAVCRNNVLNVLDVPKIKVMRYLRSDASILPSHSYGLCCPNY